MEIVVDGYNLMHLAGFASSRMKPGRFETARRRFLDWLADCPGARQADTLIRIVFDAHAVSSIHVQSVARHRTLEVLYATGETADDWIERWLHSHPDAREITVVSNDSRLRTAAKRHGAAAWSCEAFLDWLPTCVAIVPRPETAPEKPEGPCPDQEQAKLLEIFQTPKPRSRKPKL
jgi:predicted RNA-binding protein with PIN domain